MPVLAVAAFAGWQKAEAGFEKHGLEFAYFQRHECIIVSLEGTWQAKIAQKAKNRKMSKCDVRITIH